MLVECRTVEETSTEEEILCIRTLSDDAIKQTFSYIPWVLWFQLYLCPLSPAPLPFLPSH